MSGNGYSIEYWPGTDIVKSVVAVISKTDVSKGCKFWPWSEPGLPEPASSPEQSEATELSSLFSKQNQANIQISAIQGRVDTINDAIKLNQALADELAELPNRLAQLDAWKKYRIDLGRVTSGEGWYQNPSYPDMPARYTSEVVS